MQKDPLEEKDALKCSSKTKQKQDFRSNTKDINQISQTEDLYNDSGTICEYFSLRKRENMFQLTTFFLIYPCNNSSGCILK